MDKDPAQKAGETVDEYLARQIAIEIEETIADEDRVKRKNEEKMQKLHSLNNKLDSIGITYTKREKQEKRNVVNQILTIISGTYVA